VRFVAFEKLIELKLASGMTAPDRLKDLADVQEQYLKLYQAVAESTAPEE
jgi:hypothetical protein